MACMQNTGPSLPEQHEAQVKHLGILGSLPLVMPRHVSKFSVAASASPDWPFVQTGQENGMVNSLLCDHLHIFGYVSVLVGKA